MIKNTLRSLFEAERLLKTEEGELFWIQNRNVTIIAICALLLMSVFNVIQKSRVMLATTFGSAAALCVLLAVSSKKRNADLLSLAMFFMFVVLFTTYVIIGGNEGFAILWLVLVPFMFMLMIDLKLGIVISAYFLILLILVFYTPAGALLRFEYPRMMQVRFPALYVVDCAFSFYCVKEMLTTRSELIHMQKHLKNIGQYDPVTTLMNRVGYMEFARTFSSEQFQRLAVVFIDVNGLHEVNNREGHAAGDRLLCMVAAKCTEQFRDSKVFRLGGDEFLIICDACTENQAEDRVRRLDQKIRKAGGRIAWGMEYRDQEIHLDDMVKIADEKMLKNKEEYYRKIGKTAR